MFSIKRIEINNVGRISHIIYKPPDNQFTCKYSVEIIATIGLIAQNTFIMSKVPDSLFSSDSRISYQLEINGELKEGVITFDNNCMMEAENILEEDSILYIDKNFLPEASKKFYSYLHPDLVDSNYFYEKAGPFILSAEFRRNLRQYIKWKMDNNKLGIRINHKVEIVSNLNDDNIQLILSLMLTEFWSLVSNIHDFNHVDKPMIINTLGTSLEKDKVQKTVKEMNIKRQVLIF